MLIKLIIIILYLLTMYDQIEISVLIVVHDNNYIIQLILIIAILSYNAR